MLRTILTFFLLLTILSSYAKNPANDTNTTTMHAFPNSSDFYIHWNTLSPENLKQNILQSLEAAKFNLAKIAEQNSEDLSFESTFLALEHFSIDLDTYWSYLNHLSQVADGPDIRKVLNELLPIISDFYTQVYFYPNLYETLLSFSKSTKTLNLKPIDKRLIEKTLMAFNIQGAQLPNEKKEELKAIEAKLALTTQKYSENVLDSTNNWDLIIEDVSQLKGLPPFLINLAKQDAANKYKSEKTQYRFTLQAPSYGPFLQYIDDESLRKTVWQAANNIGRKDPYDNTQLLKEILLLRSEKAKLLGNSNFSDYVLQNRMAQSGQKALAFIEDLHEKILPYFKKDIATLKESSHLTLEPWSMAYLAEKLRKDNLDFDEEALRPYFPLDGVINGLFDLCQTLYGITIKKIPSQEAETNTDLPQVWHPDVQVYEIADKNGEFIGAFYTDLYPRPSKRSGAWMNYLKPKLPSGKDQKLSPGLGLICANFTPPTQDTPSLLTHREVQTIFHEMGHLLHYIFGDIPYPSLNGVHVQWDFVELPSQIMENWCWEKESVHLFAKHYQTQESLPDNLFEKLLLTRSFLEATNAMRQLSLAYLDLQLHTYPEKYQDNIEENLQHILRPYLPDYNTPAPSITCRFTHIFGDSTGYAAGYYSYKWAEALEASAFTYFQKEGILNPKAGQLFKEAILSKGDSEEPLVLFQNFTGHPPDTKDLLKRIDPKLN